MSAQKISFRLNSVFFTQYPTNQTMSIDFLTGCPGDLTLPTIPKKRLVKSPKIHIRDSRDLGITGKIFESGNQIVFETLTRTSRNNTGLKS